MKVGFVSVAFLLKETLEHFLILSFRRVLYVVCFLLGISPASEI